MKSPVAQSFPVRTVPIINWQDAERIASEWMRAFGFSDAQVTKRGADLGVDVRSPGQAIGQVKYKHALIGRESVQLLVGARHPDCLEAMLFFSRSGYHQNAVRWADIWDVALFRFDDCGNPYPENHAARKLCRTVGYNQWNRMCRPSDQWTSREDAAIRREPILSGSGASVRDRRSAKTAVLEWAKQCGYSDAAAISDVTIVARGLVILARFRHDHLAMRDELQRIADLSGGERVRVAISWAGTPKGVRRAAENLSVALFECTSEGVLVCVNERAATLLGESLPR